MEQTLESLKQKTLKELTSLKDKVSKIQHKIYDKEKPEPIINEYGIPVKVSIVYEVTSKTMANILALEGTIKHYQEKGQTALENVKKSRFLSGDYFKNYSISRDCNKVVANVQKMIDSVKTFNAEKAKLEPKKEETKVQEVQNKSESSSKEIHVNEKIKDNEPLIPVSEDEFVKETKTGKKKNKEPEKKILENENSSNMGLKKDETLSFSTKNIDKEFNVTTSNDEYGKVSNYSSVLNDSNVTNTNENKPITETKTETKEPDFDSIAITKDELSTEPTDMNEAVSQIDKSEFGTPDYDVLEDTSDDLPKINKSSNEKEDVKSSAKTQETKVLPVKESSTKTKNNDAKKKATQSSKVNNAKPVQTEKKPVEDKKPEQGKTSSTALIKAQKPMLPVVINPEKPSVLDGIEPKYFKNIFKLLNTTIVIGNKNQYNSLENLEYELSNANLETMQNLGFPVLDDPQKADLIKNVMLKFVKMSKEIRRDQWLSSLNANKKGTFEARKHTNQEAIVDRNLKLIKKLNINPELAQEYGLSLSVGELEQTIKEEKAEARKGMKKVASENNRDINFINFYNAFKNIHILGNAKDENSLYYLYNDLTSGNNSFGLAGDSLTIALNLVKQEIISTRNSKQSKTNTTKTSEKEENASTDVLGK